MSEGARVLVVVIGCGLLIILAAGEWLRGRLRAEARANEVRRRIRQAHRRRPE